MIDWDQVHELAKQMGRADLREIVDLFIDETAPIAEGLAGSGPETLDDLHFIKGSASNLGLRQLAQLCRVAERGVADGEGFDVDGLRACFRQSCDALSEYARAAA